MSVVLATTPGVVKPTETVMQASRRRLVGVANAVAGAGSLVALIWAYGIAERLVKLQESAAVGIASLEIGWWGPDFSLTLGTSLLLVGAAAAVAGSLVQQSIVFADRAGCETLERGYLWWYVLRPVWSALLGAVVVLAVNSGLVSIGDDTTSTAALTVLVTTGAVAGLFTDRALQRLRQVLGATDPRGPGSPQPSP